MNPQELKVLTDIREELVTIRLLLQDKFSRDVEPVQSVVAERPSLQEFQDFLRIIGGVPEWYSEDKWNYQEQRGWEGIRVWKAYGQRVYNWWRSEGSPKERDTSQKTETSGKWLSIKELELVEAEIKKLKDHCGTDAFGTFLGSEQERLKLNQLIAKRKELKTKVL